MTRLSLSTVAALLLTVSVLPSSVSAKVTDEEISASIERGVAHVLSQQTDKGWWSPNGVFGWGFSFLGGHECCGMLPLAYVGVPMSDPKMRKGFDALLEFNMGYTYTAAVRTMVLSKLLPKLDRELAAKARDIMKKDIRFLVEVQTSTGGWDYPRYDYFAGKPGIVLF